MTSGLPADRAANPSTEARPAGIPARVAVDLLGGDRGPADVVAGVVRGCTVDPLLSVVLCGPRELAADLLERHLPAAGPGERIAVAHATQVVTMEEDPARAVRAKRDASVRVAARLVRDGEADACVSFGSTGAALAAAVFTFRRLPGVTRPGLAVTLPTAGGPIVLLDAGAGVEASADLLVQFALTGAAYAQLRLGVSRPRVGLLSNGSEESKGDLLRREAYAQLERSPLCFVGNVEGHDVAAGGRVDVVVVDGFTGNVFLKGLEGAVATVMAAMRPLLERYGGSAALTEAERVAQRLGAAGQGGGVLLGVGGVTVVGHGAATPAEVAAALGTTAGLVRQGLLPQLRLTLADLVSRRRLAAGLPAGAP